ncbi:MAG TPA: hypothetical protein VMS08_06355, partial [Candidatus Saccharimonadia bacterium]|nr:hypothetical protein [Candidatus Saccharimonadia bacterium]
MVTETYMQEINEGHAKKILDLLSHGLVSGLGIPKPGEMCVEAAICFALDLPHGDDPKCVSAPLRRLKIRLNDSNWSSDAARAKGLERLALAQLGSKGVLDDAEFTRRVVALAIQTSVPQALRAAASVCKTPSHQQAMLEAAEKCEKEPTRENALGAKSAAYAAYA